MPATNPIGLYFPYLHFRDHDWLKAAILYWDQVHRIVPHGLRGKTNDSAVVQRLSKEEIVVDIDPSYEASRVASSFARWVMANPGRAARLRVANRATTPLPPHHQLRDTARDDWDPSFAYVHAEKIAPNLLGYLVQEGFGIPMREKHSGMLWLAMNPILGNLYMTALACEITTYNNIHPLAAHQRDQIAVLEPTMDALADDMLTNKSRQTPQLTSEQLKTRCVELVLPIVLPKHLGNIGIDRIIKARTTIAPAYRAFQDAIATAASDERLTQFNAMKNEDIRDAAIKSTVRREFIEPYDELRARMHDLGGETAERLLSVGLQLAAVAKTGGLALATKAIDLVPGIRAQHEKQRAELRSSPAAYLLRLQEEFQPAGKLTRFQRALRRFTHGV